MTLTAAFYSSVATAQVGPSGDYGGGGGGGGRRGGDDDGTDGALIAGLVVAGLAAGWFLLGATRRKKSDDDQNGGQEGSRISAIRLTPSTSRLAAGGTVRFDLQAKTDGDNRWQNITHLPQSSIMVEQGGGLVKLDGAKNIFCVPITAADSAAGQKVSVVGTLSGDGAKPMSASAEIVVASGG
jgi:hypothetical protein